VNATTLTEASASERRKRDPDMSPRFSPDYYDFLPPMRAAVENPGQLSSVRDYNFIIGLDDFQPETVAQQLLETFDVVSTEASTDADVARRAHHFDLPDIVAVDVLRHVGQRLLVEEQHAGAPQHGIVYFLWRLQRD